MDTEKIGKAIKTLRAGAGYTQKDIADLLNVTDKAVSKWERGLSVPDISIIIKLAQLLNVDVDNLLEGNITYLEKDWQGLLILKEKQDVFCGAIVYGKPLVYFYLSYFLLAGIGDIYISCPDKDRKYIEEEIGDGSRFGIKIRFLEKGQKRPPKNQNTMVVTGDPFLYGPNLTKYFQRAMSRTEGVSVLTIPRSKGHSSKLEFCNNYIAVRNFGNRKAEPYPLPVFFVPKAYFKQLDHIDKIEKIDPLYAEPMGSGMIAYTIDTKMDLSDTALYIRFVTEKMDQEVYDLHEVAKNRHFI